MAKAPTTVAWDPTSCLSIQDISLWESSLVRHSEFQQAVHEKKVVMQGMKEIEAQHLSVVDVDGESFDILRAIVKLGLRAVVPHEDSSDPAAVEILHELTASFAVHYRVMQTPPDEELQGFFQFNSVHNVWPFWRQHVYDTLKRASLPVVEVPFFSGKTVKKRRRAVDKAVAPES